MKHIGGHVYAVACANLSLLIADTHLCASLENIVDLLMVRVFMRFRSNTWWHYGYPTLPHCLQALAIRIFVRAIGQSGAEQVFVLRFSVFSNSLDTLDALYFHDIPTFCLLRDLIAFSLHSKGATNLHVTRTESNTRKKKLCQYIFTILLHSIRCCGPTLLPEISKVIPSCPLISGQRKGRRGLSR
jgi:hypothetical protein